MSDRSLGALFELQREAIRQTEILTEEMIRLPTEVGAVLSDGALAQRELQEQAIELSRQSIHRSLDAAESVAGSTGIESLRESVDETFDSLQDQQDEAYEIIEDEYDSVGEEVIEGIGEQVDLLIELSEEIETQLSETLEELPDDAVLPDELLEEFEGQLTTVTEQFDDQLGRLGELDATAREATEIEIDESEE